MENSKKIKTLLDKHIVHPEELTAKIISGEYAYYKPVTLKELETEAFSSGVPPMEFRKLILEDLRSRYNKIKPDQSKFPFGIWYRLEWIAHSFFLKRKTPNQLCK